MKPKKAWIQEDNVCGSKKCLYTKKEDVPPVSYFPLTPVTIVPTPYFNALRQSAKTMRMARQVIDDAVVFTSKEFCSKEQVSATRKRIGDGGGSLAYFSKAIEMLDKVIARIEKEEKK